MYHHRHARALARALTSIPLRHRSCGRRRYGDRIAADLAPARVRTLGSTLGKNPARSSHYPGCDGWHLTSVPARWSASPLVPLPRPGSDPVLAPRAVAR
ncbi:MAG: hypothetical protein ACRDRH_19435 [Pseudonocardia sp.]